MSARTVPMLLSLLSLAMLPGCANLKSPPPPPSAAPISTVLNMVKDELRAYAASTPATPNHGACYPEGTSPPMALVPVKVTATLQAIAARENDSTAGLAAPLGVLSIDPAFSGAYSKSGTQTITVPLTVPASAPIDHAPLVAKDHPLAAALAQFRDQVLLVDHSKTPCLQYVGGGDSNFTVSIAFDVVNKTTVGGGIQLAVFKIGDTETFTNEAHQTLDFEMAMTAGSQTMMLMRRIGDALTPR